jgi:polyferredoxin
MAGANPHNHLHEQAEVTMTEPEINQKNVPVLRQQIRTALITFSFILLPVTFAYISCPIITEGASKGIVTGGLIVFCSLFISSLFLGRFWCGYLCPGAGLQEIYFRLNNKPVRTGWPDLFKYLVFIGIFGSLAYTIYSAGKLTAIDLLYGTGNGISIAAPLGYTIFYAQIIFFTIFALLIGKRGFCHTFCPIAVMVIIGRKIRNLFGWPALHLEAEKGRCTDCKKCSKECPMSLDVNGMVRQGNMEQAECILCASCADTCPQGAVRYAWMAKRTKESS